MTGVLLAGGLLCGGNAPALADARTPKEARIKKEVTQEARNFLEAVRKQNVKAILAMVSERGLYCDDDHTSRNALAVALRRPGSRYHALLFDTGRLREYVQAEPQFVSLLELVESGGEMTLEVLFLDDPRGPLLSPCVYVKAAGFQYEPTLCFHKEGGSWRLWKSPDPYCS
jgi:hypothetical protein